MDHYSPAYVQKQLGIIPSDDGGHLRPLDSGGREEGPDQNSAGSEGPSRSDPISSYRGLSVPGVPGGIIWEES